MIYKEKAKGYKTKLMVQLEDFKKNEIGKERESIFKEKIEFERRINELVNDQKVQQKKVEELTASKENYRKKWGSLNNDFAEQLKVK